MDVCADSSDTTDTTAASLDPGRSAIVVGIDGSQAGMRAAEWAAVEALAGQTPLRLVRIVPAIDMPAFFPGGSRYQDALESLKSARAQMLEQFASTVPSARPEVSITVVRGRPEQVLLDLSRSSRLLALGGRDIGLFSHMMLGSTALAVTRDARCPVALVHRPAASRGSVLVVVTNWKTAKPALAAAFRAAQQRGTDLVVARVWQGRPWTSPMTVDSAALLVSDAQIEHCARDFPNVSYRPVTVVGDVVGAVEEFSTAAQLVVITHEPGPAHAVRLDPLTHDLVCHSPCPVLVIPDKPEVGSRFAMTPP